jgi:hypothetical protein
VNGYANLIAARLRKLADDKSTGTLPVSGHGDGAIYFRRGEVIYAESTRTPLPVHQRAGLAALGLVAVPESPPWDSPVSDLPYSGPGAGEAGHPGTGHGELVPARSISKVVNALVLTETMIDAVTELLSNESRYAKFRPGDDLIGGPARPLGVETLLAEVHRRHEVLRQLTPVVTPDTQVACQPSISAPSAQVSPGQWALLMRAGDATTPRDLALHLRRSVFGTTIEVYRLLELGLLTVPGRPPGVERPGGQARPAMSFVRAVSGDKNADSAERNGHG